MALNSTITSVLIKSLASGAFKVLQKMAKSNNISVKVKEENIEDALDQHLTKVNNFSSEISFRELNAPKSLLSVYVPLDLSLNSVFGKAQSHESESKIASIVIENVFKETSNNVVLIGAPGSGKTTTIKFICQKLLTDEHFLEGISDFPILIRLREDDILLNKAIPLFEYILNVFGVVVENVFKCVNPEDDKNKLDLFKRRTAIKLMNDYKPLIILDGLDEVSDEYVKNKLIKEINELSLNSKSCRFILTTRKGEDRFHLDNTQMFQVSPLNPDQIKIFANKWLGEKNYKDFLDQLYNSSVSDSAGRPLTLSHLCAIFEREGRIPEKSRSIYRKIVNLLILEWNLENQINRVSKFGGFDPDRKKEFLENLAYELSFILNKNQFNTSDLKTCYNNLSIKFGLPFSQMPEVINEIQVHNGLITQTAFDTYEFAHKSFQEYLAAEFLVRLPKLPTDCDLAKVPSEIALAVTLSSESTDYFIYFIEESLLKFHVDLSFLKSFFYRISIEKPEFKESISLSRTLLMLHSKICEEMINISKEDFGELIPNLDLLNEIFDYLLQFDSVCASLISFSDLHVMSLVSKTTMYYKVRVLSKYGEVNFPKTLYITKKMYDRFYNVPSNPS